MNKKLKIGDSNGFLTVVGRLGVHPKTKAIIWEAKCLCNALIPIGTSNFNRGTSCVDCGHIRRAKQWVTHGHTNTPLHKTWMRMRYRCNGTKCSSYKWYGGKCIRVSNVWDNFQVFETWAMSNGYKDGLSIDRIDSNKNYEPSNCRWLPHAENCRLGAINSQKARANGIRK